MTKYISGEEERRGARRFMIVFLPSFHQSPRLINATGVRTDQPQSHSVVGKNTSPPRLAAHDVVNPPYNGRAVRIEGTGADTLILKPQQVNAIESFAAQDSQQRVDTVNVPIAMGAAVPTSFELHKLLPKLSNALPSYQGDHYFLVPHQFVIVEKKTRRIVAIIPT